MSSNSCCFAEIWHVREEDGVTHVTRQEKLGMNGTCYCLSGGYTIEEVLQEDGFESEIIRH